MLSKCSCLNFRHNTVPDKINARCAASCATFRVQRTDVVIQNHRMGSKLVTNFYSSVSDSCGISIFSRHLCQALSRLGLNLLETNLNTSMDATLTETSILHYVPAAFASSEASRALIQLLGCRRESHKIFVILHGLHSYGEDRFLEDTLCPEQERHIRLMLHSAESITALSGSAARACRTWQIRFGGRAKLLRLDHPGLFAPTESITMSGGSYAFVGGISRSKKKQTASSIGSLLTKCEHQGVRVWEHWTNVTPSGPTPCAWRRTFGLLTDVQWSRLISHARVVLCPYQTRIQSVSGLISEALSAQRFVLSTSFELALEMKQRSPQLVIIEDNLLRWPSIIRSLPHSAGYASSGVPTWDSFATSLSQELSTPDSQGSRFKMMG